MLNKNRLLIIVLLVLAAVLFVLQYSKDSDSTFKQELVQIDTASVDRLSIQSPEGLISLNKEDTRWFVEARGKVFEANTQKARSLISDLSGLTAKRVAATSHKNWKKFDVGTDKGVLVGMSHGNSTLAEIVVGKFDYIPLKNQGQMNPYGQQAQGEMITYVRLPDEETVYATEGMLKINLSADVNDYRDKALLRFNPELVGHMEVYTKEGDDFTLDKQLGYWRMEDIRLDSLKTTKYFRTLSNQNGSRFSDVQELNPESRVASIVLSGDKLEPITLASYQLDSAQFVVVSSQYPERFFVGDESGFMKRIFVEKNYFFDLK